MILRRSASLSLSLVALSTVILLAGCSSLQSISILPATGSVVLTGVGQTAQFSAFGVNRMGNATPTTANITTSVTWSVSNPSVAVINSSGLATAVGIGATEVIAVSGGMTASSNLTVTSSGSSGTTGSPTLTVSPTTVTETFDGETTQFIAMGSLAGAVPQNVSTQITWVSSNTQVATINASGLATAIGSGTSTVTAYYAGISATATLTVSISSTTPSVPTITIIPGAVAATGAGAVSQLIAIGNLTGNGAVQNLTNNVTWSSSMFQNVSVTQTGLATALVTPPVGVTVSSTITAIGVDTTGSVVTATILFSITAPPAVTPPPASETLTVYELGTAPGNVTASGASPTFSCGNGGLVCGASYPQGTVVTLTATPAPGFSFTGWTGPCTVSTSNSCTVTMSTNQTIGATFK
jgi:trimeric autotransporter adhesin